MREYSAALCPRCSFKELVNLTVGFGIPARHLMPYCVQVIAAADFSVGLNEGVFLKLTRTAPLS